MDEQITKENRVHFVVKKEWFEQIKNGKKTHEYREYKPFWNRKLLYKCAGKYLPLPKKYAVFSLGMTKDPNKILIFEIESVTLTRADKTDLIKLNPELKNDCLLAHDIKLGKRVK